MMLKPIFMSILLTATVGIVGCNSFPENAHQQQKTALLQNKQWNLTQIGATEIQPKAGSHIPNLTFDQSTQRISGSDGCNRLMGGYKIDGAQLNLTQLATTQMMCMDNMQLSDQFNQALAKVSAFQAYAQTLKLLDNHGNVVLKFSSATTAP